LKVGNDSQKTMRNERGRLATFGKLFLFGPEILLRSQPHRTYKFLFNGTYYGCAESVMLN